MPAPVRTCIGCGARHEKAVLIRLVAVGGKAKVDAGGRSPGRGAYVCGPACAEKALKRKALSRAFKQAVGSIPGLADEVAQVLSGPLPGGIAVDRRKGNI